MKKTEHLCPRLMVATRKEEEFGGQGLEDLEMESHLPGLGYIRSLDLIQA